MLHVPVSQLSPVYPNSQVQRYALALTSEQLPPFRHGDEAQDNTVKNVHNACLH